ncbi:MAG: N-acetylmuramoyl-L-alanine amidase [Saccharothrix sp.]|nr:N-acetylmuramoyl-L-alanine amidase [Saccharothrix sp.]
MALRLVGLADALRAAGLTVVEYPGWQTRGRNDGGFAPVAVMWHHDASAPGDSPGVPAYMADPDNNGAQCWVDRAGRWHLVAAGRMWHAGLGGPWGPISRDDGNTDSVGVETDHTTGEDWPAVQLDSLRRGTVVLLRYLGAPAAALCGHKEYRPTNPDPDGLDMAHERQLVADLMRAPAAHDTRKDDDGMERLVKGDKHPACYIVTTTADGRWRRHIDAAELKFHTETGVQLHVRPQAEVDAIPTRSGTGMGVWNYDIPAGTPDKYAPAYNAVDRVNRATTELRASADKEN